jgi:hypothetical protein
MIKHTKKEATSKALAEKVDALISNLNVDSLRSYNDSSCD